MKLLALTAATLVATASATTAPTTGAPTTGAPSTMAPTGSPTTRLAGIASTVASTTLGVKAATADCRGNATHFEPDGLSSITNPLDFMAAVATDFSVCAVTEYASVVGSVGCGLDKFYAAAMNPAGPPDLSFLEDVEIVVPDTDSPEFLPWVIAVVDPILSDPAAQAAFKTLLNLLAGDFIPKTLDTLYCKNLIDAVDHATFYAVYTMAVGQGGLLAPPAPVLNETRPIPDAAACSSLPAPLLGPVDVNGSLIEIFASQIELLGADTNQTEAEIFAGIQQAIGACKIDALPSPPFPSFNGLPIEVFLMNHIAVYEADVDAIIAALINPDMRLNEVIANVLFPYQGDLCPLTGLNAALNPAECIPTGFGDIWGLVVDLAFPMPGGSLYPVANATASSCASFANKLPKAVIPALILEKLAVYAPDNFAATAGLDVAGILDFALTILPAGQASCVDPRTNAPTASPTEDTSSASTAAISAAAATFAAALLF